MSTQGRRRAYGQHFLRDGSVIQEIVEATLRECHRHQCIELLEIGPGKGAITLPLLDRISTSEPRAGIQSFRLVEKDPLLAEEWKTVVSTRASQLSFQFQIEKGDFLEVPAEKWLQRAPLAVVSNLPYSTGTAILDRLARHGAQIPIMVLMFQSEVAKRLRAEPSTPDRGSLSLWIQNKWDVQKLLHVPPRAFYPAPQVDSEVVILTARKDPMIPGTQDPAMEARWESLLKVCFSQRRKMLRSVLKSKDPWQKALELSGVDVTKRAEALHWVEWNQLFQAVRQVLQ